MGRTSNSFKSQIGRDAGKVVSNFLFGDKHATPFRRVSEEKVKRNAELEEKKADFQKEQIKRNDLYALDKAVIDAVDKVIATPIPSDERGIVQLINNLEIQLEANSWFDLTESNKKDEAIIRNKYPDAVLKKFNQCIEELTYIGASQERINNLTQKAVAFNKKRKKQTTKDRRNTIKLFAIVAIGLFFFWILGTIGIL